MERILKPLAGVRRAGGALRPPWPDDGGISVVIPVLNECRRIQSVVRLASRSPRVGEVIVVDDGSIDDTPDLARAAGARVVTSHLLGKGASMDDGLREARHGTILYLDGDLAGLSESLVADMTAPILQGWADFVKARFARPGGRVTLLTAKPLLRTYFPELSGVAQPLAGIIAARRELLEGLRFENDYGVDIGLLIDAAALGARITEVDIGSLAHESQDLEALGEMAMQVARAILERAAVLGRLRLSYTRQSNERDHARRAGVEHALSRVGAVERLALFDMDGTLLRGRFIVELAARTGREADLSKYLDRYDLSPVERTWHIARVFDGVRREEFERAALDLPLARGAVEAVVGLRRRGYRVAVVTDSYHVAAEIVRRRVFADLALANIIEFKRERATGRVTLSPTMRADRKGRLAYDKLNTLRFLVKRMRLRARDVLAVGDGPNDVGMLRAAGLSVAYQPKTDRVRAAAGHVVLESLDEILDIVDRSRRLESSAGP